MHRTIQNRQGKCLVVRKGEGRGQGLSLTRDERVTVHCKVAEIEKVFYLFHHNKNKHTFLWQLLGNS